MVTVSISETYDLSTKIDRMTLIAVHSPKKDLIMKTYPGLCMQYKFIRVKSVDCRLVAVSSLPISPDQVGQDTNQIAPQDMLNPILYKAVSNDSWSTLEARLMTLNGTTSMSSVNGAMANAENDNTTALADDFGVYYSLLSDRAGFKIAHPQAGLSMRGLKPLVFEKWYSHGENKVNSPGNNSAPGLGYNAGPPANLFVNSLDAYGMRGKPHRMPRFNTTYITGPASTSTQGVNWQYSGMGKGQPGGVVTPDVPANYQIDMPDVPPVMVGAIIIPPAKKTVMYYRMVVRAYLEFSVVRPITDITSFADMSSYYAPAVYHSDYAEQSKSMDILTDMVDVKDGSIEKIMEGR